MSKHRVEMKRVYSKTQNELICEYSAKFQFVNWFDQTKITSDKIPIHEIQACWWIELTYIKELTDIQTKSLFPKFSNNPENEEATTIFTLWQYKVYLEIDCNVMCHETSASNNMSTTLEKLSAEFRLEVQNFKSNYFMGAVVPFGSCNFKKIDSNIVTWDGGMGCGVIDENKLKEQTEQGWYSVLPIECFMSIYHTTPVDEIGTTTSFTSSFPTKWIVQKEGVRSLYDDDTFKDFTFKLGTKELKVHKAVLNLASPVFTAMFRCGLTETNTNSAIILNFEPEIFEHLLKFIYDEKLPENISSIAVDLYKVAHQYQIEKLQDICRGFIMQTTVINCETALDLYEFACEYEIEKLLTESWEFIKVTMLGIFISCPPKPIAEIREFINAKAEFKIHLDKFVSGIAKN